tara:strand:+ start:291 stop:2420 length:2130 start_codon:yes stop_codon:yes gene_type:complete
MSSYTKFTTTQAASLASCLALMPFMATAQTTVITEGEKQHTMMEEVTVTGQMTDTPTLYIAIPKDSGLISPADGGDFLRTLPGVTGSRMGGHGIDPVIRGQTANQLNIINNGAYIYNGCPNRMDPPSSYADILTTDRVIVQRGYQSVQHGPGGSGGTVIFEHQPPEFDTGETFKAGLAAGYESNGDNVFTAADLAGKMGKGYVRATGHFRDAGNYEDGNGDEVRSSFTQYGGAIEAGFKNETTEASLGLDYEKLEDVLFPGAGMDSPSSESYTLRGKLRHELAGGGSLKALEASAYYSDVDHLMDNFSLRDRTMMFRASPSQAKTTGGKIVANLVLGQSELDLGVDLQNANHDGQRLGNDMTPDMLNFVQSILLPDTTVRQIGFFAENVAPMADRMRLKTGLRLDIVDASLDKADEITTMSMRRAPNDLYIKYYGHAAEDQTEHNLGGLVRLEYDATDDSTFFLGLSRSVRTASATERSIASDMGNAPAMNMSWVGNPFLKPEKHYQIDLGYGIRKTDWQLLISAYYDKVDDYIFRDHARAQAGILVSDGATIYRNIDAELMGLEIEGHAKLSKHWHVSADAAWSYGQNEDLDIPLPQIPPLQGQMTLTYEQADWQLGGRLRAATKQTRIDDNPMTGSGRDTGETPGYVTVDLFGRYAIQKNVTLKAGISNLFDKTYADHLNRENLDTGAAVQVNEPGRSAYIRFEVKL